MDHRNILLADPYWKSEIGQNHLDYTDSNGLKITQVGIAAMQNAPGSPTRCSRTPPRIARP